MRTPNRRTMIKAAAVCLALLAVGACGDLDLGGGRDVFEAGNTYKFLSLAGDIEARVIEAPDESGWALVKVLDGLSEFEDGEVLLNTSNVLFAKRIDSEPVE